MYRYRASTVCDHSCFCSAQAGMPTQSPCNGTKLNNRCYKMEETLLLYCWKNLSPLAYAGSPVRNKYSGLHIFLTQKAVSFQHPSRVNASRLQGREHMFTRDSWLMVCVSLNVTIRHLEYDRYGSSVGREWIMRHYAALMAKRKQTLFRSFSKAIRQELSRRGNVTLPCAVKPRPNWQVQLCEECNRLCVGSWKENMEGGNLHTFKMMRNTSYMTNDWVRNARLKKKSGELYHSNTVSR